VTEQGSGVAWLRPLTAVPLDGSERFTGLDATVADFWRWAFSDLRDNTTRGILAEFLVARAVGDKRGLRIGWDNFDARAPERDDNRGQVLGLSAELGAEAAFGASVRAPQRA
jgi:hypothetical protein